MRSVAAGRVPMDPRANEEIVHVQVLRHALIRIQATYLGSPGAHLTIEEIRWMCDLTRRACEEAVSSLEAAGFLLKRSDGSFAQVPAQRSDRRPAARLLDRRRLVTPPRPSAGQADPFPTLDAIAALAHSLFVAEGRKVERLPSYWDRAEQELLERAASRAIAGG